MDTVQRRKGTASAGGATQERCASIAQARWRAGSLGRACLSLVTTRVNLREASALTSRMDRWVEPSMGARLGAGSCKVRSGQATVAVGRMLGEGRGASAGARPRPMAGCCGNSSRASGFERPFAGRMRVRCSYSERQGHQWWMCVMSFERGFAGTATGVGGTYSLAQSWEICCSFHGLQHVQGTFHDPNTQSAHHTFLLNLIALSLRGAGPS